MKHRKLFESQNTVYELINPLTRQTQNPTGTTFIKDSTAYTANQNYTATQTDARGKVVARDIDLIAGTLTSVTDPNGQSVGYTYDTLKRLTDVQAAAGGRTYRNNYTYTDDKLTAVKHNTTDDTVCDVQYNFAYDAAGRPTTVKIGTQSLSTNTYNASGTLQKVTYGNGGKVTYSYDSYKRVTGLKYDTETVNRYNYAFGANGQVAQVTDNNLGHTAQSEYDTANRPMRVKHMEGSAHVYTGEVAYDGYNNLQTFKEQVGVSRTPYQTDFTYDNENKPTELTYGSASNKTAYAYDAIGRVSTRTVTAGGYGYASAYGYVAGAYGTGSTTPLIASITQSGENFAYEYDDVGNITKATRGTVETTYSYDPLGQLTRANDPADLTAGAMGTTWVYAYDRGGNILSKTAYVYTTGTPGTPFQTIAYVYDGTWKDKLASYNGAPLTYDAIGNPLTDGTWTYTWQAGRQLASMTNGTTTASFDYNAEGLRIRKTVGSTATEYALHGKNIVHLTQGSASLHFFYDAQGRPSIVDYNGTKYAYVHNLQGDIVGILNASGTEVVRYTYDAWGRQLSKTGSMAGTLGTYSPFRYRGYVYDEETGLYYLRSRYYSPVWQRFINSDVFVGKMSELLSHNQFCYCKNCVLYFVDDDGSSSKPTGKMPVSYMMPLIATMERENWSYIDGGKKYGSVDCIGVILYCVLQYYGDWGGKRYTIIIDGKPQIIGQGTNSAIDKNIVGKKGELLKNIIPDNIIGITAILMPGMVLYRKDLGHVGVYVGYYVTSDGKVFYNAVIHAPDGKNGVIVQEVSDTSFYYYCQYKYIDYDMTYNDTLPKRKTKRFPWLLE